MCWLWRRVKWCLPHTASQRRYLKHETFPQYVINHSLFLLFCFFYLNCLFWVVLIATMHGRILTTHCCLDSHQGANRPKVHCSTDWTECASLTRYLVNVQELVGFLDSARKQGGSRVMVSLSFFVHVSHTRTKWQLRSNKVELLFTKSDIQVPNHLSTHCQLKVQ